MEQQRAHAASDFQPIVLQKLLQEHKPSIARFVPPFLIRYLERLLHIDEINQFMLAHHTKSGMEFVRAVNTFLDLSVVVNGQERLADYLSQRPIIVANHPLGGPESLLLLEVVANESSAVRMVTKSVITALQPLEPILTPIPKRGVRASCEDFKQDFIGDHPIVMFPAGYCSRPLSSGHLFDFQWYPTFVKMARRTKRPIVPIHIDGENSQRFYRLSSLRRRLRIKTSLESMLLPDEMFHQRGKVVTLTVGQLIHPELLSRETSDWHWADVIRNYVFTLGHHSQIPFDPLAIPVLPLS